MSSIDALDTLLDCITCECRLLIGLDGLPAPRLWYSCFGTIGPPCSSDTLFSSYSDLALLSYEWLAASCLKLCTHAPRMVAAPGCACSTMLFREKTAVLSAIPTPLSA